MKKDNSLDGYRMGEGKGDIHVMMQVRGFRKSEDAAALSRKLCLCRNQRPRYDVKKLWSKNKVRKSGHRSGET